MTIRLIVLYLGLAVVLAVTSGCAGGEFCVGSKFYDEAKDSRGYTGKK